jgi:hypothetical protein
MRHLLDQPSQASLLAALGLVCGLFLRPGTAAAQCEPSIPACQANLAPFQSVGHRYFRAEIFPNGNAKLRYQFEFDRIYRIVPCGTSDRNGRLAFNVYDRTGVLVFSSTTAPERTSYDFDFGTSGQYTFVVGFEQGGGCAALLIGTLPKDSPEAATLRPVRLGRP